ncbi:1-deoxy-D-xylulose-5-phosphate reductoisomerase [Zavarzinia compransoris]|uniref:1-deoxy-D-xylulose 5-phosphate reductoisomerase n=1 Tax=Zavarzinia compransoris TaxID=1264899 RepID=A0A317EC43_9PROT|nr:1-deoxy-D-xylulose-5-phosphate reductoisomerase [Zavarzinia compransoris]PWR23836.1 1-deoxy-D-xylulose-5-phosphate reductoisomerase [Zavarzinia compransoris]TDP48071.1 1-deoxy-D-xylulose 5-phosphate reductoisomerase [Zavarzinia compransoris]
MARRVTVLGSTGSVGTSTLDLVGRNPDQFEVAALVAHRRLDVLVEQARRFRPAFVASADEAALPALREALAGLGIEVGVGPGAVVEAAKVPADLVMSAIVGAAGLAPTLAAVERGAIVALANKEALVCAGDIFTAAVARHGATLLPVDSEHNAIFQVFDEARRDRVARLILTASGGPFRSADREVMERATPAQAVAHPNWSMGAKISVDSATMMNKGLELIEAHHLFAMPEDRIDILVHPQSVIHSLVEYVDGSVLAQLGSPDMRVPIAYALAWPDRMATPVARLDLASIARLTFEPPDAQRFPALALARHALKSGGAAPTILNAANEVAVAAFLGGRIGFLDIAAIVDQVLDRLAGRFGVSCLDDVMAADAAARRQAEAAADQA